MANSRIPLLSLFVLGFFNFYGCAVAIHFVTPDSAQVVNISEPKIVITCEGADFDAYGEHPIIFSKVLPDGQVVEISTNHFMKEPFKGSPRHSISKDEYGEEFNLTITDVTLGDNGTYTCEFYEADGSIEHTVTVIDQVEEIELVSDSEVHEDMSVFKYIYGSPAPYSINCTVKGGNPMPEVSVHLNGKDITTDFQTNVVEVVKRIDPKPGLDETLYEVSMTKTDFLPEIEDNGLKLRCTAKIPKSDFKKTERRTVDVEYGPQFECASSKITATGNENVQLTCLVHANPPITINTITWSWQGDNGTEIVDKNDENYIINAETLANGKVEARLVILLVNETDFRLYTLTVENSVSRQQKNIELRVKGSKPKEDLTKPDPSPGGVIDEASVTSLSLSVAIATLLATLVW